MRKIIFGFWILLLCFLPQKVRAYVNIIENWDGATINNIQENFGSNAFVVVAGDPYNDALAQVINNYSFTWVIRGHSHWLSIGQKMWTDPEGAAADWNTFLRKINKPVYFEPWNEPTSIDPECQGQPLEPCMVIVNRFINALRSGLPGNIILTTPSIDPHNGENTASRMIQLLGDLSRFQAISYHVYSPDLAKDGMAAALSAAGLPPMDVVITESGIISGGGVVYTARPLCEEMYCGAGVVDYWKGGSSGPYPIKGWALFTKEPGGGAWDLWQHQCVINALKGECDCSLCPEGGKPVEAIIDEFIRKHKNPGELLKPVVSRGLPEGPNPSENSRQGLLGILMNLLAALFPPGSWHWPFARNMPSLRVGDYGGEDPWETNGVALNLFPVRMPSETYVHSVKFFSLPGNLLRLLVQFSWDRVKSSAPDVFADFNNYLEGAIFSRTQKAYDLSSTNGKREYRERMLELQAGPVYRMLPRRKYDEEVNGEIYENRRLLGADDLSDPNNPIRKQTITNEGVPIPDTAMTYMCESLGTGAIEKRFKERLLNGDVDRTQVEGCGDDNVIPINLSTLYCFNENSPFPQYCSRVSPWAAEIAKTMEPFLFSTLFHKALPIVLGSFCRDLPVIIENCHPAELSVCHPPADGEIVYKDDYGKLSPDVRLRLIGQRMVKYIGDDCEVCRIDKIGIPCFTALNGVGELVKMATPNRWKDEPKESNYDYNFSKMTKPVYTNSKIPVTARYNDVDTASREQKERTVFGTISEFIQVLADTDPSPTPIPDEEIPERYSKNLAGKTTITAWFPEEYDQVVNNFIGEGKGAPGLAKLMMPERMWTEMEEVLADKFGDQAEVLPQWMKNEGLSEWAGLKQMSKRQQWESGEDKSGTSTTKNEESGLAVPRAGKLELTKILFDKMVEPARWQN